MWCHDSIDLVTAAISLEYFLPPNGETQLGGDYNILVV